MRNPQTVSLTWKPYPENRPKKSDEWEWFLLTFLVEGEKRVGEAEFLYQDEEGDHWLLSGEISIEMENIIAFAELPEPYKED